MNYGWRYEQQLTSPRRRQADFRRGLTLMALIIVTTLGTILVLDGVGVSITGPLPSSDISSAGEG